MTAIISLNGLMEVIGNHWRFDGQNYRGYDQLDKRGKQLFPLKHTVLHYNKSLGALAAEAEKADHGDPVDNEALRVATTKMLATTLNLANHLGMTPRELAEAAETIVRQV